MVEECEFIYLFDPYEYIEGFKESHKEMLEWLAYHRIYRPRIKKIESMGILRVCLGATPDPRGNDGYTVFLADYPKKKDGFPEIRKIVFMETVA